MLSSKRLKQVGWIGCACILMGCTTGEDPVDGKGGSAGKGEGATSGAGSFGGSHAGYAGSYGGSGGYSGGYAGSYGGMGGGYAGEGYGGEGGWGYGGSSPSNPRYCGTTDSMCMCYNEQQSGTLEANTCTTTMYSGAALCCRSESSFSGWPSCVCSALFCWKGYDTCICSRVSEPDPGETAVSSCSGQVCCKSPSVIAPMCACYTNLSSCLEGDIQVASCSTEDLECGSSAQTVSSCVEP